MKLLFLSLALFMVAQGARAQTEADNCSYHQEISGGTVASLFFTESKGCLLQVTPQNKPDLVYREYLMDERGSFQIFDSISGPFETSTGTRTFFFFPRRQAPNFSVRPDGRIDVVFSTQGHIVFNPATTHLESFTGARFTETATVGLDNGGGIEFSSYNGIWLDVGWRIGGSALLDESGSSVFHDAQGHACTLKNSEIVDYQHTEYGEPLFRSQTDAELATFLKAKCPELTGVNF